MVQLRDRVLSSHVGSMARNKRAQNEQAKEVARKSLPLDFLIQSIPPNYWQMDVIQQ